MADKITPAKEAVKREAPPKPQKLREEAAVRWPSAAGASGGAYIPSQNQSSGAGKDQ